MINAFLRRMYKHHFVSELIPLWTTWIGNFLSCCFPQPTVYILYSLQSKVICTGSAVRPRDHNLQLPVCNCFSRKSFIIRSLFRFK